MVDGGSPGDAPDVQSSRLARVLVIGAAAAPSVMPAPQPGSMPGYREGSAASWPAAARVAWMAAAARWPRRARRPRSPRMGPTGRRRAGRRRRIPGGRPRRERTRRRAREGRGSRRGAVAGEHSRRSRRGVEGAGDPARARARASRRWGPIPGGGAIEGLLAAAPTTALARGLVRHPRSRVPRASERPIERPIVARVATRGGLCARSRSRPPFGQPHDRRGLGCHRRGL